MKFSRTLYAIAITSVALTGCVSPDGTPNNTGTGALAGSAFGALAGAVIGGQHAGEGALIGAAAGALAGGLVGHAMDQEQRERLRAQAPQTYARVEQKQPLSLADVQAMVKAGVSDDVIIEQIRASHTVFNLSTDDIIGLHNAGVSEKLISFMISTPNSVAPVYAAAPAAPAPMVLQAPPPPPVQPVVVAPGPGYVWIGGEWQWTGGSWVWVGGRWAAPPYPRAVWVSGYWHHGPHGWYHARGYWR